MLKDIIEENIEKINKAKEENSAEKLDEKTMFKIYAAINGINVDDFE